MEQLPLILFAVCMIVSTVAFLVAVFKKPNIPAGVAHADTCQFWQDENRSNARSLSEELHKHEARIKDIETRQDHHATMYDVIGRMREQIKQWPDLVNDYTKAMAEQVDDLEERLAKYEHASTHPHGPKPTK